MESRYGSMALFFTKGVSLVDWNSRGLLSREKIIYEELIEKRVFSEVFWITYGSKDSELLIELKEKKLINEGIHVLPKPSLFKGRFGNLLFSFLSPLIFYRVLSTTSLLKTNQINGCWSALIAKFIFFKPLFLRCGFILSKSESLWGRKSNITINLMKVVEKISFNLSDCASVTNYEDRNYLVGNLGIKAKITVNHSFIDTDRFKENSSFHTAKDELLFIGRLSEEKNLIKIIEAAKLNEKKVFIISPDSSKIEDLLNRTKEIGAKIEYLGSFQNKDLPGQINKYKYFILCSESEGLPKALLEAMACKRVCIGTDVVGINSLLQEDSTGFLSETTSVDDISSTIRRTLKSERKEEIRENARRLIEKEYGFENFYKTEIDLISSVI